ncbi:GTPase [Planobispora longispora]|uniref:GTPase n=1 Tax=Planobispora longispora TaxID=28887 RepID=UPI001EF56EAF|nr:GTPase [Planobispora longispora]
MTFRAIRDDDLVSVHDEASPTAGEGPAAEGEESPAARGGEDETLSNGRVFSGDGTPPGDEGLSADPAGDADDPEAAAEEGRPGDAEPAEDRDDQDPAVPEHDRVSREDDPADPAGGSGEASGTVVASSGEDRDETEEGRSGDAEPAEPAEDRGEAETDQDGINAGEDETASGEDGTEADQDEDEAGESEAWATGDWVRETPLPEEVSEALTNALTGLRESVTDLSFGLDLPGAEEARRAQTEILTQLDDYVIPRVHTSTAPALIVIAGSTGAGKSTLLNTLANAKVSATGVRRPTTGTPVLACHPDDHEWFAEGGLLGSLERRQAPGAKPGLDGLVLVSTERLPQGVALLDTPDIDSVVEEHHEIAHRMLDAADLWIFVTTAARYADAPAWRLLRLAKERGARLAIVLSRVPPKSREVVTKHFVRMLTEYGLGEVERFVIDESKVVDGMLPDHEITELRLWLAELSVDDQRRTQAVRATLNGALDSFRTRVPALARQLEAQVAIRGQLRGDVDAAYTAALAEIDKATRNGSLLRGEMLARWQDFAGSGDLMRTLRLRKPGRFAGKASRQGPERLNALKTALRTGLESVIVSAAQRAAEETVSRWQHRPGAAETLALAPGLSRPSDELLRRTNRTVAAWQDHLVQLIRTEGVTKRAVTRLISFDVESLAVIFAVGLLGYGAAESEGKGALPQRLLHALFGAESLRNIGAKARSDLRARIGMLFDDETSRYIQVLDGAGIPDESAATRLYQATYNLEVAR